VESLAARVPDLEGEVATLRAVCGKQHEALKAIADVFSEGCPYFRKATSTHCEVNCSPTSLSRIDEECYVLRKHINDALSLTPASVAQRAEEATTAYHQTDDDYNTWECEKCHEVWCFNEGTPKDNEWRYCPKCGRRAVEVIAKARDSDA
jgi:hypothetical protein